MNKTKIIVAGANGRMGKSIIRLITENNSLALVGASENPESTVIGVDAGLNAAVGSLNLTIRPSLEEAMLEAGADVIIDFTSIEATLYHVKIAMESKVPLVIGTTGFHPDQIHQIKECGRKIPIVLAPNMSVGMNLMFKLTAEAARILNDDYDIEVFEAHHKHKKDAPSGTAVKLAQILCESTGRNYPGDISFHREGVATARSKKEIGMQVLRGGDIVGEHTVYYCGEGERLEIKHVATSRDTFAKGALRAAQWLVDQNPGIYNMWDVLGLS